MLPPSSPRGLRVADRYRVDGRLLRPGRPVDAVDPLEEAGGRRVRLLPAPAGVTRESLEERCAAWNRAAGEGLPLVPVRAVADDAAGPVLVLPPAPGCPLGRTPPAPGALAEVRVSGSALRAAGIPIGALTVRDLALDAHGRVVFVTPPLDPAPTAGAPGADVDRLVRLVEAAVAGAAVAPPPAPRRSDAGRAGSRPARGRPRAVRLRGRRPTPTTRPGAARARVGGLAADGRSVVLALRGACLVLAAALVVLVVLGSGSGTARDGGDRVPGARERAPARAAGVGAPAAAPTAGAPSSPLAVAAPGRPAPRARTAVAPGRSGGARRSSPRPRSAVRSPAPPPSAAARRRDRRPARTRARAARSGRAAAPARTAGVTAARPPAPTPSRGAWRPRRRPPRGVSASPPLQSGWLR